MPTPESPFPPVKTNGGTTMSPFGLLGLAFDYAVDAAQRSILFLDVMRQRGNQYREHLAESAPHVLDYKVELVVDGRRLERPVNYALARVVPPPGVETDQAKRPFVVVDPRAGHGPGIGGFKADSEIGVAFGGRDRDRQNPVHHRCRRAVQDGGPRTNHRRNSRWPARIRQCHRTAYSRAASQE